MNNLAKHQNGSCVSLMRASDISNRRRRSMLSRKVITPPVYDEAVFMEAIK